MRTIEDIKQRLYESYPNVDPNMIDKIIEIYFEEGQRCIADMVKPEIAFTWGILYLASKTVKKRIAVYKKMIENYNNGTKKIRKGSIQTVMNKVGVLEECFEMWNKMKIKGKTSRGVKRKFYELKSKSNKPV